MIDISECSLANGVELGFPMSDKEAVLQSYAAVSALGLVPKAYDRSVRDWLSQVHEHHN